MKSLTNRIAKAEEAIAGGASKLARQAAMSAYEFGLIEAFQIDELASKMSLHGFWKEVAQQLQAQAESRHVERQQEVPRTIA